MFNTLHVRCYLVLAVVTLQTSTNVERDTAVPTIASTPTEVTGAHVLKVSSSGMTGRLAPKPSASVADAGEG